MDGARDEDAIIGIEPTPRLRLFHVTQVWEVEAEDEEEAKELADEGDLIDTQVEDIGPVGEGGYNGA